MAHRSTSDGGSGRNLKYDDRENIYGVRLPRIYIYIYIFVVLLLLLPVLIAWFLVHFGIFPKFCSALPFSVQQTGNIIRGTLIHLIAE